MSREIRKPKGKLINPTFFVFCEGKTEELYIKFLKSKYRLPIDIDTKIAGNRINASHIRNYKSQKQKHPKDRTYLMYDLDAPKMLEKLQGINNTFLISSNPCFELWYLLHFQELTGEIDSNHCLERLQQQFPSFRKEILDEKLKFVLDSKQEKAIHRAMKLEKYKNPSSEVFRLIQDLEEVKKATV